MTSDEERREVAAKLRELPSDMYEVEEQWEARGIDTACHDQTDYYLIHYVLLRCFPAEHMHLCDYEELHNRLADLIEPEPERTCRPVIEDETEVCSDCGYDIDGYGWSYCPNCGAKLVEE